MILAVPAFTAVIMPSSFTLTTEALLLFQVRSEVAPFGSSVVRSRKVSPTPRISSCAFSVTLSGAFLTVSVQVAFFLLAVVTVILAVPAPTAVTRPVLFTVATLVLSLVHVRLETVPAGSVATSCRVSPALRVALVWSSVTFLGALASSSPPFFFTVTTQVAFLPL